MGSSVAIDLWQKMVAAVQSGDLEAGRALLTPDFEWQAMGRGPFAGRYVGIEGMRELFGQAQKHSDGTFQLVTESMVGDDTTACMIGHVTATRPGKTLDMRNIFVVQVEGGRIARGWTVPMDQYVFDSFWQ